MPLTLHEAIAQLTDRSSTKRRAAAKRLRALADPAAGPALLAALQTEMADPRTWETKYQMIMALGTCRHTPAGELLGQLASEQHDYTMIGVALGDALVRIDWASSQSLAAVDRYMPDGAPGVVDGTFRAIAMLQLIPDNDLITRILAFVTPLDVADPLRYWVAAAAASWTGPHVEAYLRACVTSNRDHLVEAATASLEGVHLKHRPL